ncbi:HalOD1 output domain-containing protein [Natrarchaeobaculum aegyptiacum]|uniref:HalOD1 output domain-containing protein n=1 Tax=Natrarchaeobaculum aegyptiacum TaxID=745377 RepID=UPI003742B138
MSRPFAYRGNDSCDQVVLVIDGRASHCRWSDSSESGHCRSAHAHSHDESVAERPRSPGGAVACVSEGATVPTADHPTSHCSFKLGVYLTAATEHGNGPNGSRRSSHGRIRNPGGRTREQGGDPGCQFTEGCDPCELTPLYWTIDPELLDELCASQQEGTVKFVYDDIHITVENGEYLLLRPTV